MTKTQATSPHQLDMLRWYRDMADKAPRSWSGDPNRKPSADRTRAVLRRAGYLTCASGKEGNCWSHRITSAGRAVLDEASNG